MKRSIKTILALPVIAGIMLSSGCNASRATTRALIVNFSSSEKEYMEEIEEQASKLETTTQKPAENSAVNSQDGGNQGNANGSGSDNGNTGNGDNNGNNNNNNNNGSEGNKPNGDNNGGQSGSTTSKNDNQTSNSNGGTSTSKPSGGNATTPSSSQGQGTPAPETSASQGGSTGNDTPASSASSSASSSAPASTTKPAPSTTPSSFIADWQPSSTWSDGANYCGGYELKVENKTGKDLTSWTATFTVPSGFKFTSSWNGDFSVSGTTATVKNLEYNGNVANGGTIGFGFNYSSPVEFTPGNVTINGVGSSNGSAGGGSGTATSTAAAVTTVKPAPADPVGVTPFAAHGKLTVKGTQIVDKNGNAYQLKGMSTHGLAWFPKFINESCFKTLRDDWKINCIRIAMYTAEYAGYCEGGNKAELKKLIDNAVTYADKLGLYVIIDWHVLQDKTPQKYKADAKLFFEEMASKYKNHNNVLYEICNEPNSGATWTKDIKPYAEEIIPIIRKYNKDAIVIVGTPTWSQDIDQALSSPLKYSNVMYALHFYAATHTDWLRNRLKDCVNKGLPVFVTEFGCCDASGNGANDFNQTKQWLKLLDSYGISYMNWNLANKNESSSAFKEKAGATGNWSASDFSESGAWIRKWFRGEIA